MKDIINDILKKELLLIFNAIDIPKTKLVVMYNIYVIGYVFFIIINNYLFTIP